MEKVNIFTDFKIKNIHIKNRIVLPPMVRFSFVEDDGYVTEALIEWYGMIARSGVGLIIVEASAVEESGKLRENQIGIWNVTLLFFFIIFFKLYSIILLLQLLIK